MAQRKTAEADLSGSDRHLPKAGAAGPIEAHSKRILTLVKVDRRLEQPEDLVLKLATSLFRKAKNGEKLLSAILFSLNYGEDVEDIPRRFYRKLKKLLVEYGQYETRYFVVSMDEEDRWIVMHKQKDGKVVGHRMRFSGESLERYDLLKLATSLLNLCRKRLGSNSREEQVRQYQEALVRTEGKEARRIFPPLPLIDDLDSVMYRQPPSTPAPLGPCTPGPESRARGDATD